MTLVLEEYIQQINTVENLDECRIFIQALKNNNHDIVKLAIMRGILYHEKFTTSLIDLTVIHENWNTINDENKKLIADHYLRHVQQKSRPLKICSFLSEIVEKYILELDKLYCTRIIGKINMDHLTVLKCNMDLYDLYDTQICNLRILKAVFSTPNHSKKLYLPKLEKLYLTLNHKDRFGMDYDNIETVDLKYRNTLIDLNNCYYISEMDFPNLIKLSINSINNIHTRAMIIRQNTFGKFKNLKYLKLCYFRIRDGFYCLSALKTLKLRRCVVEADIKVENLFMTYTNQYACICCENLFIDAYDYIYVNPIKYSKMTIVIYNNYSITRLVQSLKNSGISVIYQLKVNPKMEYDDFCCGNEQHFGIFFQAEEGGEPIYATCTRETLE